MAFASHRCALLLQLMATTRQCVAPHTRPLGFNNTRDSAAAKTPNYAASVGRALSESSDERRWMDAVQGFAARTTCHNKTDWRAADAKRQGNDWQLCLDEWDPATDGCLAVSIGIGNSWQFDDALATRLGCEVHSFDPTGQLRAAHMAHHVAGVHFHYAGLGAMRPNAYGRQGVGAAMLSLDELLSKYTKHVKSVSVLKIDCEGCEWQALRTVAETRPQLLDRVRLLLLELHVSSSMQMRSVESMRVVLRHLFVQHDFRVYAHRLNLGKMRDRFKVLKPLQRAGLDAEPCCYELHLMRPQRPSAHPWRRVARPTSEPSLETIRAEDHAALTKYDRVHGTRHVETVSRMRKKAVRWAAVAAADAGSR